MPTIRVAEVLAALSLTTDLASGVPFEKGLATCARLHAYWTGRMLERCPGLRPLAGVAGAHHERLDGHGYHRGVAAG